ncbi:MAG: aminopeptidase [Clostridiales bacterium]|nr:aminopeptidase [Clostridiales bacterium]
MISEFVNAANENHQERYELSLNRIREYALENNTGNFAPFFCWVSDFASRLDKALCLYESRELYSLSSQELALLNKSLYNDVMPENYDHSYMNPEYCASCFGKQIGPLLSHIAKKMYDMIIECFAGQRWKLLVLFELINYVYVLLSDGNAKASSVKNAIYYYYHDYCGENLLLDTLRRKNPDYNEPLKIIRGFDLCQTDYLYYYGSYIGENELLISKFLAGKSEEEIFSLAKTFVDGYIRGFAATGIDFSSRKNIEIRYCVGFERIILEAVKMFEAMGKRIIMYMDDSKRLGTKSSSPNRQFEYDHRNDFVYFLNKRYTDVRLELLKQIYDGMKDELSVFAGPVCVETFGENEYEPVNKKDVLKPCDKNHQLYIALRSKSQTLIRQYIDFEQVSFTIIAFPIPEIGDNFEEIFEATDKVNTLDNDVYTKIQQTIIDALDKCDYCHILGLSPNSTDLKVNLYKLNNPEKETIFENCVADVNIPVGEVFTTPVLKGTEGILNVSHAYLEGYEYKNLFMKFEDGFVTDYGCDNFSDIEEGKEYVKENILKKHEKLPMGEFAIGTNTTAYGMAEHYKIWDRLPILIAEKTGPHFAVGDTCYSDFEDYMTYNPDGKAVVARDNEVTLLRKSDRESAYFNCHTDITIPYDEIASITGYTKNNEAVEIIRNGRFVLKGTEMLNDAFKQ